MCVERIAFSLVIIIVIVSPYLVVVERVNFALPILLVKKFLEMRINEALEVRLDYVGQYASKQGQDRAEWMAGTKPAPTIKCSFPTQLQLQGGSDHSLAIANLRPIDVSASCALCFQNEPIWLVNVHGSSVGLYLHKPLPVALPNVVQRTRANA
jgi:hypothetical protein